MPRMRYVTCSLAVLVFVATHARGEDITPAGANAGSASVESRAVVVANTILQQHIDPPTRQEMILSGAKAVYRASDQTPPAGLSERISQLSADDEFADYLNSLRAKLELPDFERILINGMLQAVPGGGGLVESPDVKVQQQLAANRYVGIGIALALDNDEMPFISKVFYDGPGWKAGIKADDMILEIDGVSTKSMGLADVVKLLRGEEGTEVTLIVQQPDAEPRTLTIIRGVTFIPTVEGSQQETAGEWQFTIDSADDIALLRFRSIGPSTLHELRKAEAKLRGKNIRGIVLDLRSGGGILHDTVMLADQLLDGGTIGHIRTLKATTTHEARPGCLFQGVPLAVLISKHSNADRVFLTAALQDQGRAVVIGEPTVGETYVNSYVSLPGGDQIRLATGIMQRADGTTLLNPSKYRWVPIDAHQVANPPTKPAKNNLPYILPDHVVSLAANEGAVTTDAQLDKAIQVLRATDGQANTDTKYKASVSG